MKYSGSRVHADQRDSERIGHLRPHHAWQRAGEHERKNEKRTAPAARSRAQRGRLVQPGLTVLLLINAIAVAIKPDTSLRLPGTIIVLLVLASAW